MLIGIWLAVSRAGTSEVPRRKSPSNPRTARKSNPSSPNPASKTPKDKSPKVTERKSTQSPISEVHFI